MGGVMRTETKTTTKTMYIASDGNQYESERECQKYEAALAESARVKAISDALEFEALPDHLALCKGMYWDWWNCEFGAPAVDPKRPYGNSGWDTIYVQIAHLIGLQVFKDADDDEHLTEEQRILCDTRHREMENWFQILSSFGEIPSGMYRRLATYQPWYRCHVGVAEIDAMIVPDEKGRGDIFYRVDGGEPFYYSEVFDRARNAEDSLWGRVFQMEFDDVDRILREGR